MCSVSYSEGWKASGFFLSIFQLHPRISFQLLCTSRRQNINRIRNQFHEHGFVHSVLQCISIDFDFFGQKFIPSLTIVFAEIAVIFAISVVMRCGLNSCHRIRAF